MSEIERAISVMQQHKCEEIALYGDEYNLAIQALQEKQEREKGCPECEPNCHNCKHDVYDDFCGFYGTHGCDKKHFEPKNKFCPNCGRDLRKGENDG